MATQVQLRRGTAAENDAFTGAQGEVTVDTTNDTLRVHDGSLAGGYAVIGDKGGTIDSGNLSFGDNDKAIFGAGSDLQIYHDGSNSYIKEAGTGYLYIQGSDRIYLQNADATGTYARFVSGAEATLYHNNAAKLATTSTGVDISGNVTIDSAIYRTTTGAGGIRFATDGNIRPTNTSGTSTDLALDIGDPDYRFDNLYLGGGVYLGGTGSANYLDDYEEGAWTPVLVADQGFTTTGTTVNQANYVKVGNTVTVFANINFVSSDTASTGDRFQMDGLPFNVKTTDEVTYGNGSGFLYGTFGSGDLATLSMAGREAEDQVWGLCNFVNGTVGWNAELTFVFTYQV